MDDITIPPFTITNITIDDSKSQEDSISFDYLFHHHLPSFYYVLQSSVDYAKSERQFRVNGAAVPFPTAHQRRSLFIDFITLAHAYSVHSFQDGKNAFCQ